MTGFRSPAFRPESLVFLELLAALLFCEDARHFDLGLFALFLFVSSLAVHALGRLGDGFEALPRE